MGGRGEGRRTIKRKGRRSVCNMEINVIHTPLLSEVNKKEVVVGGVQKNTKEDQTATGLLDLTRLSV